MKKFWASKKFLFVIVTLIIIGVFIFIIFILFEGEETNGDILSNGEIDERFKDDKSEPASQIKSPVAGSWHNQDFTIDVLDEDLDSGINSNFCQYEIFTYESDFTEYSTGWLKRKCNSLGNVSVGENGRCGIQGWQACWIYVRSQDRAGNQHHPAEEKKSIVYYHIDWTNPQVEKVFISSEQAYPLNIKEDLEYELKVRATDNLKVVACELYVDSQSQGLMIPQTPGCSQECFFSKNFVFPETKTYEVFAICKDAAQNSGKGETVTAKTNLIPQISSCRVTPTQGNSNTLFQFSVEASDPDGDILSFLWDFGDGQTGEGPNPTHYYQALGTYEPKVKAFDQAGGEAFCSTAWLIVE